MMLILDKHNLCAGDKDDVNYRIVLSSVVN